MLLARREIDFWCAQEASAEGKVVSSGDLKRGTREGVKGY